MRPVRHPWICKSQFLDISVLIVTIKMLETASKTIYQQITTLSDVFGVWTLGGKSADLLIASNNNIYVTTNHCIIDVLLIGYFIC